MSKVRGLGGAWVLWIWSGKARGGDVWAFSICKQSMRELLRGLNEFLERMAE